MQVQASVEGLLKSLGLEKYLVTFRAEEVCLQRHACSAVGHIGMVVFSIFWHMDS